MKGKNNKHAYGAIANSLKHHKSWCYNPNDPQYRYYGCVGRKISKELLYTNDPGINEKMVELVIAAIGEKPEPHDKYHLHVDWQQTNGIMTVSNISWELAAINQIYKESNHRSDDGRYLASEARQASVAPKTAASRFRRNKSFDDALNPQLRADIDFSSQIQKFTEIRKMIERGEVYVDKTGQVYLINSDSRPYPLKGQKDRKTGYWSVKLKVNGRLMRVARRHIVLLQYADFPSFGPYNGIYNVWNADHINADIDNDSPDNLCWMLLSFNSGEKTSNGGINNNCEYVKSLAEQGHAILCISDYSPYSQDIISNSDKKYSNSLKESINEWQECLSSGWTFPNEDFFNKIYPILCSDYNVPISFLIRIALAPSNRMKLVNGEIHVTSPTTGKQFNLGKISANNDSASFAMVYSSQEVSAKLKLSCEELHQNALYDDLAHFIPTNSWIEAPGFVTFRSQLKPIIKGKRASDIRDDYFKIMPKSAYNSSLLMTHPHLVKLLVSDENGNRVNPFQLMHGSLDLKISTLCFKCFDRVPPTTVKAFTRSTKSGDISSGNLCKYCLSKNSAQNGMNRT